MLQNLFEGPIFSIYFLFLIQGEVCPDSAFANREACQDSLAVLTARLGPDTFILSHLEPVSQIWVHIPQPVSLVQHALICRPGKRWFTVRAAASARELEGPTVLLGTNKM